MNKRLLSVLLSLLLILSLIPLEAFAVDSGGSTAVNVKLHGKNIKDYEDNKGTMADEAVAKVWNSGNSRADKMNTFYDTVYLGGKAYYVLSMSGSSDDYTYNETKNPDGIHTIATYTDDGGSEVDSENAMFLLSDEPLGCLNFGKWGDDSHYWSRHTPNSLYDKLNGDTYKNEFYNINNDALFSDAERAAILKTTKYDVKVYIKRSDVQYNGFEALFNQRWTRNSTYDTLSSDLLGDKIYPLSVSEVFNTAYGLNTKQARMTYGAKSWWWLRSSAGDESSVGDHDGVGSVSDYDGGIDNYLASCSIDVRPALNLNQNCILFASDAADNSGKMNADLVGTFTNALATTDTNQWKLTLTDSNLKLNSAMLLRKGEEYKVKYSGAATDANTNTYLSAIIVNKDTGDVLYYGKLMELSNEEDASGMTESFKLPEGVALGDNIVMQIFVEKVSGSQTGTDYASEVMEFDSATPVALYALSTVTGISAVTTSVFAIEASRIIGKRFITNNSIFGKKVIYWIKNMHKIGKLF